MTKVHAYRTMKVLPKDVYDDNVTMMGIQSNTVICTTLSSKDQLEEKRVSFTNISQGSYVCRKVPPDRR